MKSHPLVIVLIILNLVTLVLLARSVAHEAQAKGTVLRGQALELVDATGQVRSRLNVEESGEVVFRMMDPSGTIRLKIGAGADGSGMVLLDDQTEPGVQMLAEADGPILTLFGEDGRELVLTPSE